MLRQVRDPRLQGIDLTPTGDKAILTKSGWWVECFDGDDGETYERAQKGAGEARMTRWFRLDIEEAE